MKPALTPIETITRVAPNGKPITVPAHWFGLPRFKTKKDERK
jgi:hypothetical protein